MLANLGNPADVSDSAALEHERDVSAALVHAGHDEDSRRRLDDLSGELIVRVRARGIDPAGRASDRLWNREPDSNGWVEYSLPGWPIRMSYGVGLVERDESATTRVEVEVVRGPPIPAGVVPAIIADGENDSDLLESASVGFAIVNTAFVLAVLVATYLALAAWTNNRRATDEVESHRLARH